MAVHVLKPGQSVTIKVVDAHELSAGMRMLESTYLVYGVLAEIERIWSTGGRGGHHRRSDRRRGPGLPHRPLAAGGPRLRRRRPGSARCRPPRA